MVELRVALVCFDNPFLKPIEGGKRSMISRIHALQSLGVTLDIYALSKRREAIASQSHAELGDRTLVFQYQMRRVNPTMFLRRLPVSVQKRIVPEMRQELMAHTYDAIIYEGEHVAEYKFLAETPTTRNILYFHDIESNYRSELARSTKSPLRKLAQIVEGEKYLNLERRLSHQFDECLFISNDELSEFRERFNKEACVRYAPYAVDRISPCVPDSPIDGRLLYVGDLTVDNNYRSVHWLITDVLSQFNSEEEISLRIVGRISARRRELLESLDTHVVVAGYVDDIDREYKEAACVLAPVLYGAGVKVKVIDALARGQIVIATTKACEGTNIAPGKHLLVADNATEFARLCENVVRNRAQFRDIAQEGLNYVRRVHSIRAHASLLKQAIEGEK